METYGSNSHRSKEESVDSEKKKINSVVTGKVTRRKNVFRDFTSTFISEDIGTVKAYVIEDVLVPALKKAVVSGIEMFLFGETSKKKTSASTVSYRSYYDRHEDRRDVSPRARYSFDDIVIESRPEAEEVLNSMDELLDVYKVVSVADMYDLMGITDVDYTTNKYGWTSLKTARVERVRDGYIIRLPKAMPID